MTKLILILALAAMGAGIYYSLNNYKEYNALTESIEDYNGDIDNLDRSIDSLNKKVEDAIGKRDAEEQRKLDNEAEVETLTETIDEWNSKKNTLESENSQVKTQIGILEAQIPDDLNPEDFQQNIKDLEQAIEEKKQVVATLEKQLQTDRIGLANRRKLVAATRAEAQKFLEGTVRNELQASVSAVNDDYSFVVINIPRGTSIEAGQPLIVTRDGQRVGGLKVTTVEPSQVVADIVSNSNNRTRIVPGDRVILGESTEQ